MLRVPWGRVTHSAQRQKPFARYGFGPFNNPLCDITPTGGPPPSAANRRNPKESNAAFNCFTAYLDCCSNCAAETPSIFSTPWITKIHMECRRVNGVDGGAVRASSQIQTPYCIYTIREEGRQPRSMHGFTGADLCLNITHKVQCLEITTSWLYRNSTNKKYLYLNASTQTKTTSVFHQIQNSKGTTTREQDLL